MRVCLLITLFFFCFSVLANEERCKEFPSIDHKGLWPEDSIRQQCDTGSCHSFATVSLIEALHKKEKDEFIDLSERDLFSQHFGASNEKEAEDLVEEHLDVAKRAGRDLGQWIKRFERQKKLNGWTPQQTLEHYASQYRLLQEGGYVDQDFNLLRNEGICKESELPFSWFSAGEKGQEALNCLRQARFDVIKYVGECKINGTYSTGAVEKFCKGVEKVLEEKDVYAGLITEVSKICLEERKKTKSFVKTLSLKKKQPRNTPNKTKEEFHRYLSCQPMAMDIKGYSNILNGVDKPGHGLHAVALAGYDCKSDEYIVRNSWGAGGYDRLPAEKVMANIQTYYIIHKGKYKDCK